MRDRSPGGAEAPAEESAPAPPAQPEPGADPIEPDRVGSQRTAPWLRRGLAALGWTIGAAALFFLFLQISRSNVKGVNSDAANNALQAFDMLHGNLLLHGWLIGDATYYTFELPVILLVEVFFGLHTVTMYVAEAVVYLIVAAWAIAIAVTGSRGMARAARAAVVVAVLAAPTLIAVNVWLPLGIPDHTGTAVFLLIPCLLVDRVPDRWFTAPLLAFLLCAGQIGDVTVRYVAVPAIVGVCAYRVLATRKLRSGDAANLLAAALSVPLSLAARAAMLHDGAYLMVSPKTTIAPARLWEKNAAVAWGAIRMVFGIQPSPPAAPPGRIIIFGYACLLVTVIGSRRVLGRWRTAGRGEQVRVVAIAGNMAVYIVSTLPVPNSPHDIVAVLPGGAVLAARALVPERITGRLMSLAAAGFAMAAALLPLSVTAARPPNPQGVTVLSAWLEAHGLTYGVGGYWDGSALTLQTAGKVQIVPVQVASQGYQQAGPGHLISWATSRQVSYYAWETDTSWFDPTRHYANFAVFSLTGIDLINPIAATMFGKPVGAYSVGSWEVLVYDKNLLTDVTPAALPPTS